MGAGKINTLFMLQILMYMTLDLVLRHTVYIIVLPSGCPGTKTESGTNTYSLCQTFVDVVEIFTMFLKC